MLREIVDAPIGRREFAKVKKEIVTAEVRKRRVISAISDIMQEVERHDWLVETLLMNVQDYTVIRNCLGREHLDIITDANLLRRGKMAILFGAEIVVRKEFVGIRAIGGNPASAPFGVLVFDEMEIDGDGAAIPSIPPKKSPRHKKLKGNRL